MAATFDDPAVTYDSALYTFDGTYLGGSVSSPTTFTEGLMSISTVGASFGLSSLTDGASTTTITEGS